MRVYILKRLLLIIPTLFMIMLLNFTIIQFAPGGPVEQAIQRIALFQNQLPQYDITISDTQADYQIAQGLTPEMLQQIKRQYGFDQNMPTRFIMMIKNYFSFDFGQSFFKDKAVSELIQERLWTTISLGLWSMLLIYSIAIPLGVYKAQNHMGKMDRISSVLLIILYAIPSFVIAMLLIVFFAGGSYWQWFPLQGLTSANLEQMTWFDKIKDYFWHLTLPTLAIMLGGFASLSYLTKYAFLEELSKQYVMVIRSRGVEENKILYRHVFRNAMLIVISHLPEMLFAMLFTGNLLIEILFNIDGLALLGFEAIVQRDYPIIFATLYLYTLIGLLLKLVGDILYHVMDPRIHFDAQK